MDRSPGSTMDSVKSFNEELSSLYELKPPISKARMTAVTKGAIKAIKYYKHVVQSVEKFIQKCRPGKEKNRQKRVEEKRGSC
jgi:hypothetical protein